MAFAPGMANRWQRLSSAPATILLLLTAALISDRITPASGACDTRSWSCSNGDCIPRTGLCDGRVDCADRSDETAAQCITNRCPGYSFRCSYGACVAGSAECNGIADCADNSDELTAKCREEATAVANACAVRSQFRCGSGECVSGTRKCDGQRDCYDGSDETLQLCAGNYCPSFAFRCGYGGCVHGHAQCNGTEECADGSDELVALCGDVEGWRPPPPPTPTPSVAETTGSPAVTTSSTTQAPDFDGRPVWPTGGAGNAGRDRCLLRLDWNLNAFYAATDGREAVAEGTRVANGVSLVYRCLDGFFLIPNEAGDSNYCLSGKWSYEAPRCERRCSFRSLDSASTMAQCSYEGVGLPCSATGGLRPRTQAAIACRNGYRKPQGQLNDRVECEERGAWSASPMRCEQVCGVDSSPTGTPYIVNGDLANNTVVPWHVGIYSDTNNPGHFEQICGGTIISNRVVISSAHCFWSKAEGRLFNAAHFRVGIGKYYRTWDRAEPLVTQRVAVHRISAYPGYADVSDLYNADIVLLHLSQVIEFHSYVLPICMENNLKFNEKIVTSNQPALVAGWGLNQTGGVSSEELKVLELPTVSFDDCRQKVPAHFRRYVTTDKFCAGYIDQEKSVCQGDSGGGLVTWRETATGERTYFLRGLVSSGVNRQLSCDSDKYTVFTNVHFYSDWIVATMSELER